MKPEMRQQLAQLPFEEKTRKVGELIRLSRKMKLNGPRRILLAIRNRANASPANASPVADSPSGARTFGILPKRTLKSTARESHE